MLQHLFMSGQLTLKTRFHRWWRKELLTCSETQAPSRIMPNIVLER